MISLASPSDWERLRALRLAALADAPDAFGSTLASEQEKAPPEWVRRLEDPDVVTFLATEDDLDVGMCVGRCRLADPDEAGLYAMWVAPSHRGRGVGGRLVDTMVAWARSRRAKVVVLDVADENVDAIRLYSSRGFTPTGRTGTLPEPREHVKEHQMALKL